MSEIKQTRFERELGIKISTTIRMVRGYMPITETLYEAQVNEKRLMTANGRVRQFKSHDAAFKAARKVEAAQRTNEKQG